MIVHLAKVNDAGSNATMNANKSPESNTDGPDLPKVKAIGDPISVPVFNCIVYVARDADGVSARVANLAGLDFKGNSEPDVLRRAVTAFKERVGTLHGSGETIPWIDPPDAMKVGEQQRLIPVHL